MWLGLVFIGYFVVSAALDDLDIEVSTVNRFHGDDGGGDEVGGMTPRSSKRMHSAAPGISLMAMGSPEMEMADNMAMSFDVPPSMAPSELPQKFIHNALLSIFRVSSTQHSAATCKFSTAYISTIRNKQPRAVI